MVFSCLTRSKRPPESVAAYRYERRIFLSESVSSILIPTGKVRVAKTHRLQVFLSNLEIPPIYNTTWIRSKGPWLGSYLS